MPKYKRTAEDKLLNELCPDTAPLQNYVHELGRIPYAPITKGENEIAITDISKTKKAYYLVRC